MSEKQPVLEARGLVKRYGQVTALDGADLELYPAEILAVIGDNGAGKSTLIKAISGALVPDDGEILLNGEQVQFHSPLDARRLGIETVYQDLAVAPALDIPTNLFLGREKRRPKLFGSVLRMVDKGAMRDEAWRHLSELRIGLQSLTQPVENLSGGQRQGVAVARAAAWALRVVIMDEPTAALGVKETRQVLDLILRVRERGLPVILISHDMPHVFELSDRIQIMRLGKRAAVVTPQTHTMPEAVAIMTGASRTELEQALHKEAPPAALPTATIGLILEDVSNPFSSALHRAIEDHARERGMLVFSGSCDEDPGRERELIQEFRARRVDGIVVVPASPDHSYLLQEQQAGTPLVFVDRPARSLDADSVTSDNVGGARQAVAHLGAVGHRRIGCLGDEPEIQTAEDRLRGYTEGLALLGVERDPALIRTGLKDADVAEAAAAELLQADDPPTALFTAQNLVTIGALRALRRLGHEHRVALVGFDDIDLAEMLEPAVTVIAQNPAALGRAAAELLFRRLDGDDSPPEHVVVDVELIARGSGEIPP
jgi:fructose transport system ATP-binding protein